MTVHEICMQIEARRQEALAKEANPYPRSNPVASDLSECARETALGILHWQDRPPFPLELIARFRRGKLVEDYVLGELRNLGFSVRQERYPFELKHKGRVVLRGHVDGFIQGHGKQSWPLEVKSLHPNIFRQIQTVDDFGKYPWARKYPRQVHAYLYAHGEEEGFFLLDDLAGQWRLLPVRLDFEEMSRILERVEAAVDAVEAVRAGESEEHALPPYHEDPVVCRACWAFGRVCVPPAVAQGGLMTLDDEELIAKLDRRGELEAAHREWVDLDEEVKAAVKGKDGLVAGSWLVRGREVVRQEKAREAREVRFWQTKIESVGSGDRPRDEGR